MMKIAVIGIVGNSVFLPVEKFHVGGETVEASSIHFEFGGKGFNQAVAAARSGAEVSFLAAVGKEYRKACAEGNGKEPTVKVGENEGNKRADSRAYNKACRV